MDLNEFLTKKYFTIGNLEKGFSLCKDQNLYIEQLDKYCDKLMMDKRYLELLSYLNVNFLPKKFDKYIGQCLYFLNEYESALQYLESYEKNFKDNTIYNYLGDVCQELDKKKEAIFYYEHALKYQPNNYLIHGLLAQLYSDVYFFGEKEKQIYHAKRAFELEPNNNVNVFNMFLVTCRFNMVKEAKKYYHEVLKFNPSEPILFSYGCFLIRNRNFEDGFKLYRHRFVVDDESLPKGLHDIWQPNIQIKDKTILITYEQGFGDTFMFIRFIREMKSLCKEVKLLVQEELYDLIKYNYSDFEIYKPSDIDKIEYDYFIPMLDIPLFINLTPDNIPYKEGYLKVDGSFPIKSDKFKIGISFEGSLNAIRTGRDMPLKMFEPLMNLPNVELYSFQVDDKDNQMAEYPEIIQLRDRFHSFSDTARALKEMDLVITTDNCILNLACALGLKTFGLFNEYQEFRWFDLSEDMGWYNQHAFQCEKFNKWETVMDKVAEEVKKLTQV